MAKLQNVRTYRDLPRQGDQSVRAVPLGQTAPDAPSQPPAPTPGRKPAQAQAQPPTPAQKPAQSPAQPPAPGRKPAPQPAPTPGQKPAQAMPPTPGQKPDGGMPAPDQQTTASGQMPDAPPPRPPQPPAEKGIGRVGVQTAGQPAGDVPTPPTRPTNVGPKDEQQMQALEGIRDRILNEPGFVDRLLQNASDQQKQALRANLDGSTAVGRTILDALGSGQPDLARSGYGQIQREG